uniref:Tensin n=1 Tax=Timema bartmani TaxID=61472 RepID=A0A7R9F2J1_9NEOP|nr:unnamed protein product [Timema bartmani]
MNKKRQKRRTRVIRRVDILRSKTVPLSVKVPGMLNPEVNHTFGPLDGSLYATISKKQQLQQEAQEREERNAREAARDSGGGAGAVIGSPHTVSMDSGISSAGNGLLHQASKAHTTSSNNTSNSSTSPPLNGGTHHRPQPSPSTSVTTPLSPEESHRALDELLNDMLQTVENIPDLPPSTSTSPFGGRSYSRQQHHDNSTLDDLEQNSNIQYSASDVTGYHHYQVPPAPRSTSLPVTTNSSQKEKQQQLNNGYAAGDILSATGDADILSYIDDVTNGTEEGDIPYHARQDSQPFTYGVIPIPGSHHHQPQQSSSTAVASSAPSMLQMHPGLASPSLVRKASFKGTTSVTSTPVRHSPPRDFVDGELSPPSRDYHLNNGSGSLSPRSPEFHDGRKKNTEEAGFINDKEAAINKSDEVVCDARNNNGATCWEAIVSERGRSP